MVPSSSEADIREAVASVRGWYHTIDLPHGITTPGWFDMRPVVGRIPWPDVSNLRCLDVGTWDGFLAFELERRGASEVVATDIGSHEDWDHLPGTGPGAVEYHEATMGEKGRGFAVAAQCLGSKVRKEVVNIYDLSPDHLGMFDVVTCGSLLMHLRDPFRALAALRSVCRGHLLSIEQIDVSGRSLLSRQAALTLQGADAQWSVPTLTGHPKMLRMAGFEIVRTGRPFAEPLGVDHPPPSWRIRDRLRGLWLGGLGVPKSAVLARPR